MENQIQKSKSWINRHPVITTFIVIIAFIILVPSSNHNSTKENVVSGGSESTKTTKPFEVVSIDTKIIERNSVWWKYSWIMVIKNNTDKDRTVDPTIKWYDKDGFAVETDYQYGLTVPANSEETFSGYQLINVKIAPTIEKIQAEIN